MPYEQFTRNDIVKAWQTVNASHDFLQTLIDKQRISYTPNGKQNDMVKTPTLYSLSEKSLCSNNSNFIMAETAEQLMRQPKQAIENNSSNSMVFVESNETESQTIALSDETIIKLSQNITITHPGLINEFLSGYFIIPQQQDESDIQFAKRRLSAITPPLLQIDSVNIDEKKIALIHEINRWHAIHCFTYSDSIEHTLVETAFYFDDEHKRLIVRHTPIETETPEKQIKAKKRQKSILEQILKYLQRDELSNIHHITPTIVNGIQFLHIILTIENEATKRIVYLDSKTAIPMLSSLLNPNTYYHLNMQSLTNNTDCGRYITVAATIAAKILSEQSVQTLESLTLKNFTECETLKKAAEYKSSQDVKTLLKNLKLSFLDDTHLQSSSLLGLFSRFFKSCENYKKTPPDTHQMQQYTS